jgi:hypothetical protein
MGSELQETTPGVPEAIARAHCDDDAPFESVRPKQDSFFELDRKALLPGWPEPAFIHTGEKLPYR